MNSLLLSLMDLRAALRMLAKNPGFTAAAIVALALGVGANSSIFSIVNEVFLRPIPLAKDQDRLLALGRASDGRSFDGFTHPGYLEYRAQSHSFSGLMAYRGTEMSLAGGGGPIRIRAALVSHNYFPVLGVNASLGRTFLAEEDQTPGSHPVVMASHRLWKQRFGSDLNLMGRTLVLNGQGFTVVGIAPEGFVGVELGEPADVWIPLMMEGTARPLFPVLNSRMFSSLTVIGRLKPGVSMEQAQAEMAVLAHALEEVSPATKKQMTVILSHNIRFRDPDARAEVRNLLALLMAAAGVVLIIACANVANLLLARASIRRRETAVRLALGASRIQLARHFLTESMLLTLFGGACGIFVGAQLTRLPQAYLGSELAFSPDIRVLAFTFSLSLLAGIVMGLAPALQASTPDLVPALKGFESSGGFRGARLRGLLVVLQVALSLVLVVGAGLLVSTMRNLQAIDLGFDIHRLLVFPLDLRPQGYQENRVRQMQLDLIEHVKAIPGVQSASLANGLPVRGMFSGSREILAEGREQALSGQHILVDYNDVAPHYFETLGMPLVMGRTITEADKQGSPLVAVISETMARRYWPGENPIGKRLRIARFMSWSSYHEIIGVVKDTRYNRLEPRPAPHLYVPLSQNFNVNVVVLARVSMDPQRLREALQREAVALDPSLPLPSVRMFAEELAERDSLQRMIAALASFFGFIALTLASIGIYALMSYAVVQRTREIGIRLALGARQWEVLRLIMGHALTIAFAGVAIGLAAALPLARIIVSQLYGISPSDPLTLAGSSALLIAIAMLASYVPARRAVRVDPSAALRHD